MRWGFGLVVVGLALVPGFAEGAGLQHVDQGARGMGRAGAFTAAAADPTAIVYNPAGLALLQGVQVVGEGFSTSNAVRFRRRETPYTKCTIDAAGQNVCTPDHTEDSVPLRRQPDDGAVTNAAGAFLSGMGAASYTFPLGGGALALGVGVYGPPANGQYRYPAPDYSDANWNAAEQRYEEDPRLGAPQRYALIESDIVIAYPSVAVAWRPREWLAVGATLQYVYSDLHLEQAVFDGIPGLAPFANPGCNPEQPFTCGPQNMREEDPMYDSLVALEARGDPTFTGVLGALARVHPRIWIGASWRPAFTLAATGKISFQPSRFAQTLDLRVLGDEASVEIEMPHEVRAGVRALVASGLELELDGVYEGWSSLQKIVVTPRGVSLEAMGQQLPLPAIVIEKGFRDSWSARLGAEYALPVALPLGTHARLRAGLLYESGALPREAISVDFPNWERYGETVGFSLGTERIEASFALALIQQPDREVEDSAVRGVATAGTLKPYVIGNGSYESSYTIINAGLSTKF